MEDGLRSESWIKLGDRDFEVLVADFDLSPDERAVVVRGSGPLPREAESSLSSRGFRKIAGPSTVWARPGSALRPADLRQSFPKLRVVPHSGEPTRLRVRGASPFVPFVPPEPKNGEADATPAVDAALTADAALPQASSHQSDRMDNKYQSVYHPASKLGEPIAMIPVNMRGPTARALAVIEAAHGPVDGYVADKMGYTLDELAKALSPEQIDAVAMGLAATERKREMILADQTGLGKGRVLAALMLCAAREGKTVVFVTEKANLFSDIFRDLSDIGALEAIGKPFLLNSDSVIRDVTSLNGDILHESLPAVDIRKVIKSRRLPDGCRFLMCTYSQFNRLGSEKEKFLAAVSDGAYAVVDEAHNAAGDGSNTSTSLENGLSGTSGVIRSSATFARRAESLLAYPRVLPPGLRSEDVRIALQAGGNAIAEAVAQYLAEDGVLIRREHDLSGIKIDVVVDEARKVRNMEYSDALAPILARLAQLQRLVDDEIEIRNEDAQKEGGKAAQEKWYSPNFGSRRAPLLRQFLTALSVDFCVERCVESLLAGEKPVVVIEQTMESLMRELASDGPARSEDDPSDVDVEIDESVIGTKAPDFRDALLAMLDRVMHMSVRRGKEDPEKVPVEEAYVVAEAEEIKRMIAGFPDLSLSPIDDIRDRIEEISKQLVDEGRIKAPWKADEISARNLAVRDGAYTPLKKADRNSVIVGFNSGGLDALVITRAASTGLSLHASEKVADRRPRRMIELQIPANVVERVQFWGRVNRRGQVCLPFFETLSTGLPSQMRTLAMNNRKVESLSATVSANAATATAMDIPDMIDTVGNEVARRILTDQPRVAEQMFVAMRNIDPESAEQELYYINKFLQGFCYISSEEGEELFERLLHDYRDLVKGMKAQGKTPRGNRELDGEWKVLSRERYEEGNDADGPVFGRPVDLVTMESFVEREPVRAPRVAALIGESRARLAHMAGKPAGPFFEGQIKALGKSRRSILNAALSGRHISVDQALKDKEANAVKSADERLSRLCETLATIAPGVGITVPDEEGGQRHGVVVDVRPPDAAALHHPGAWAVRYALPGDVGPTEISIATLLREKGYRIHDSRPSEVLSPDLRHFDAAPAGKVETRQFLEGNLVRAMLVATEISAGSMVTFTAPGGERRRSVLVHRKGERALRDRTSRIRLPAEALSHLANGNALFSDYRDRASGLRLSRGDYGYVLSLPKGKDWERLKQDVVGRLAGTFKADKLSSSARVADENLEPLVKALIASGMPLHFDNRTIQAKQNRFGAGAKQQSNPFSKTAAPR